MEGIKVGFAIAMIILIWILAKALFYPTNYPPPARQDAFFFDIIQREKTLQLMDKKTWYFRLIN